MIELLSNRCSSIMHPIGLTCKNTKMHLRNKESSRKKIKIKKLTKRLVNSTIIPTFAIENGDTLSGITYEERWVSG